MFSRKLLSGNQKEKGKNQVENENTGYYMFVVPFYNNIIKVQGTLIKFS
jgi:hypothetical protein